MKTLILNFIPKKNLEFKLAIYKLIVVVGRGGRAARRRTADPLHGGSNPSPGFKRFLQMSIDFVIFCCLLNRSSSDWKFK